jgi:pimeloyl-ACP methyl ester carboxylesterase
MQDLKRKPVLGSWLVMLLAVVVSVGLVAAPSAPAGADDADLLPIVFVHGLAGSGQQYQTQAMRFASNGYPDDRIRAFEYDTSNILLILLIQFGSQNTPLTNFIDSVRAEFGVDQVHLVAHSLGTTVANLYLGNAARAARVAKYIGIDGSNNANCGISGTTAHMECMGIFATSGNVGGNNVILTSQAHTEVVTSAQSFAAQYEFFTGEPPATTLVLPEPPGDVRISGRAVNFPANTGVAGATLEIWEVERQTGHRKYEEPEATFEIGAGGQWGPAEINGQQRYEFVLRRPGSNDFHTYTQPIIRSSRLVRLLYPPADILNNTHTSENHTAAAILRNREFYTTHPSGNNDVLLISTSSASRGEHPPVDVFAQVTANNIAGVHVHDAAATPGVSTLNLLPFFPSQPFQTGVDVFMPATSPPDGTVSFVNAPRGDTTRLQVINTPNWASSEHGMLVILNDYVQDIDTWGQCRRAKPSPCPDDEE